MIIAADGKVQEENALDPVENVLDAARGVAGELREWGVNPPKVIAFGPSGPITIIDDRDRAARRPRTCRFDSRDLTRALGAAASVSIIPYEKRGGRRVGRRSADWHALTLGTRLREGGAVVILTTSDRVRHWLEEARHRCNSEATLELYDRNGVAAMVEGGA